MNEKLKNIVQSIDDARVKDIKIYETASITPFFDYAIVATALSSRQLNAALNHLHDDSLKHDFKIKNAEGQNGGYWLLVDLEDVIVNVFVEESRDKYALDKLWGDLPQIDYKNLL